MAQLTYWYKSTNSISCTLQEYKIEYDVFFHMNLKYF